MDENSPFTKEMYSERKGISLDEAEKYLEGLVTSKKFKKRYIKNTGFLYWDSSVIYSNPFINLCVNSQPYEELFSHITSPEHLSDEQLNQERVWLKSQYRHHSKMIEELNHLSKSRYDPDEERHLEVLTEKWIDVSQQALLSLQHQLKIRGKYFSVNSLIQELGIKPSQVNWNSQTQEFQ